MATTMTTVDDILKEVYEHPLRDQLQSEILTLRRIEKTSEGVSHDVGGKYVRFPVRVKRNHGIGARDEMEPLPEAKTQDYRSAQVNLANLYGTAQLSGQTFELAKTNPQTFISALDAELDGMREGLAKDTNRQVYGTQTGTLATAVALGTSTTFITDNAQYVEFGMIIDVFTNAGALSGPGEHEITNIQEDTPVAGQTTITFTPAAGAATTTDWTITRHGSRTKEKVGFEQILDPNGSFSTLFNINHPIWTSNVDASGGAISEGRMIQMVDRIRRRGGKTTVIFTSLGVRRAYFNLLVQQRRYTNTTEFEGGFSGLAFTTDQGDIPVVSDFDCQPGRMYFINEKEIKLYQAGDWSFMDRDGSKWYRVTGASGDLDAYKTRYYKYCQLGTHRRNSHGLLTDITEA